MMAFSGILYYFLLFYLPVAFGSFTVFQPVCSKPTTSVNFVSSSDSRSTLQILWSSLFTIFACTWTIQHPNVPEQRNGRYSGFKGSVVWGLKRLFESAKLAFFIYGAPELIIMSASLNLIQARRACREVNEKFWRDEVPWTLAHSHFANMGGFVIRAGARNNDSEYGPYSNPYHLTARGVLDLRHKKHLDKLPEITEEELQDKSKSDPLLKAVAVGQILWSITQISARAFQNLAISPLELSVLAFSACAIIIYALYWKKPQRAEYPITIMQFPGQIPQEVLKTVKSSSDDVSTVRAFIFGEESLLSRLNILPGSSIHNLGPRVDPEQLALRDATLVSIAGTLAATLFGGIHVFGWNFTFPHPAEQIIWRCATVYTASYGPMLFFPAIIIWRLTVILRTDSYAPNLQRRFNAFQAFLSWLYVIARVIIVAETFSTLFFLPPNAFVSTWTSSIPHFS